MEITEVRVKLMDEPGERLQAFCSITFDDAFVVRDLKIIEGSTGPFVAMPSRKLTAHCAQCGCKNHLRAAFCNQCGGRLKEQQAAKGAARAAGLAQPVRNRPSRAIVVSLAGPSATSAWRSVLAGSGVRASRRSLGGRPRWSPDHLRAQPAAEHYPER